MKIAQIGGAGHAFYAYDAIKRHGFDFAALAPGNAGIGEEGTKETLEQLRRGGFSPVLFANWKAMIDEAKPDIVIVNPWFNDIAECSVYALGRDINVFSEKPLASDIQKLRELEIALASSKGKLAGMFETRYEPAFLAAKKAINDGLIGEVRMMDSRKSYKLGKRPVFYSSEENYCGIIPWVAIHAIDWMKWLSARITYPPTPRTRAE